MRKLTSALFVAALIGTGCSGSPSGNSDLDLAKRSPHLAAIPSDTPYAFASIEPMPLADMVDKMFSVVGPQMDAASDSLVATFTYEGASTGERLLAAYLKEFKGKYNRAGLESLGFSLNPRMAIYGISWLPAVRYELKDPVAFQDMLRRIEADAGVTAVDAKIGEYAYRAYAVDGDVVALAFQGNEMILGFAPQAAADVYLPYLLGDKKPSESLLKSRKLEELVEKYGFKPYLVGFVDIERITQMLVAPQPGLNEDIAAKLDPDRQLTLSPVCQTEIRGIAAHYPRVVGGYDDWSVDTFSMRGGLEMTNGLGTKLAQTHSNYPGAGSAYAKSAMGSLGMGIDIGALLALMGQEAGTIVSNPYQCEDLAELNDAASQFSAASMMIPPVVADIKGASVILKSINLQAMNTPMSPDGSLDGQASENITGAVLWKTTDAVALMNTLKMYIPELANLTINADGTSVQLPPLASLGVPDGNNFIAMGPTQIAITTGQTAGDDATELSRSAEAKTAWLAVQYDPDLLMATLGAEAQDQLAGLFLGPVTMEIQPTEAGLFFTYRQDFKK